MVSLVCEWEKRPTLVRDAVIKTVHLMTSPLFVQMLEGTLFPADRSEIVKWWRSLDPKDVAWRHCWTGWRQI